MKIFTTIIRITRFFNRYRCTVGGQLVQDIDQYNRHCELYNSFKSVEARHMDDIESRANPRWDDDWRHKYANGLDQFVRVNNANDDVVRTAAELPTGADAKDYTGHNKWGKRSTGCGMQMTTSVLIYAANYPDVDPTCWEGLTKPAPRNWCKPAGLGTGMFAAATQGRPSLFSSTMMRRCILFCGHSSKSSSGHYPQMRSMRFTACEHASC